MGDDRLKWVFHEVGGKTVLQLGEDVSWACLHENGDQPLLAALDGLPEDRAVVVDLSLNEFVDSAGLRLLLRLRPLGRTGPLPLVTPQGSMVRLVLDATGLTEVFALHDDLDDALAQTG